MEFPQVHEPRSTPMKQISLERLLRGRLKLRQLWLLVALERSSNLLQAAAKVGVTQPAATRLLRELEDSLGVRLFDRSTHGVKATNYGMAMIRHAHSVLADINRAREEIESLAQGAAGVLSVGVIASISPDLLARAVSRTKTGRPGVHVRIQEGTQEMLLDALRRGDIDLLLGRMSDSREFGDLNQEVLYLEQFRVVAGPDNRLSRLKQVALADLVDEPWILSPPWVLLRQRLLMLFLAEAGRVPTNIVEANSTSIKLLLLREGPFLALLTSRASRLYKASKMLCELPIELPQLQAPVTIITRGKTSVSPVVEAFAAILKESAGALPTKK